MNNFKVKDRVEVLDYSGKWWSGTLININFYRERPYCVELDDYKEDVVFVPTENIRLLKPTISIPIDTLKRWNELLGKDGSNTKGTVRNEIQELLKEVA